MPTVTVEGDDVVLRFTGMEPVWALRRSVRVPRETVRSAAAGPPPAMRGLRAPGTHVPGRLTMGTWRGRFGTDVWAARRRDTVLVVEHDRGRLVAEVDDPFTVAATLQLRS